MPTRILKVEPSGRGQRVDRYLSSLEELPTRSQLQRLHVEIRCGGKTLKPSHRLEGGELLTVEWREEVPLDLKPIPLPLSLIYEDADTLILDKPRGLSVHPGSGRPVPTLVHGILAYLRNPPGEWPSPSRPGIVHRLDKETTGVLVCAKNTVALDWYAAQFRNRSVSKTYLALVRHRPPQSSGRIDTLLARDPVHRKKFHVTQAGGKRAVTLYEVLASSRNASLLKIGLLTGRTHQIRVHLSYLGCPILGDAVYSRNASGPLLLHSWQLGLTLTNGQRAEFTAPLPADFKERLSALELGDVPGTRD